MWYCAPTLQAATQTRFKPRIDPLHPRMTVFYCFGHRTPKSQRWSPESI